MHYKAGYKRDMDPGYKFDIRPLEDSYRIRHQEILRDLQIYGIYVLYSAGTCVFVLYKSRKK